MTYKEPDIRSSYRRSPGFGQFLYDYVYQLKPKKIVEFGMLHGFSAISMAEALRDLGEGHLYAYDNWSRTFPEGLATVLRNIEVAGVSDWITVGTKDFKDWINEPEDFDLLHIDVDNTGETLKLLEKFKGKNVIFEGGIKERDEVAWMENKLKMNDSGVKYEVLLDGFPGLSKLI